MMASYWPQTPAVNFIYSSQDSLENFYYPHLTVNGRAGLDNDLICRSKQGSPGDKVGGNKDKKSLEAPEAC